MEKRKLFADYAKEGIVIGFCLGLAAAYFINEVFDLITKIFLIFKP